MSHLCLSFCWSLLSFRQEQPVICPLGHPSRTRTREIWMLNIDMELRSCFIPRLWDKKCINATTWKDFIFVVCHVYGKSNFKILWTSLTLKIPLHFNYNFYKLEKLKLLTKTFKNSGKNWNKRRIISIWNSAELCRFEVW